MSLFSTLLNPLSPLEPLTTDQPWKVLSPGAAMRDANDNANSTDQTSAPTAPTPTTGNQTYGGNPNDPAFGSFTQPFDVQQFYKYQDPGYWFRRQQGEQGIVNSNAAGSGARSGSAMKDLLMFNQDAASQEYGNAFNRYQTTQGNIFSRLFDIAGLGQSSASNVGAQGTALAGQAGQAIQNQGTAQGGGIVGAGNALGSAGNTYGAYQFLANNPNMWRGNQSPVVV